jgi:dolichol-phosphate mannosyltransferase
MKIQELESTFISIVVYAHNNGKKIYNFLETINNEFKGNFKNYEFIVVNDASRDDTKNILKDFSKKEIDQKITVINMSYYQGIESSMNAGIDHAIGDFVFEFDTTYIDYDVNLIYEIYIKSLSGYDIIIVKNSNSSIYSKLFYYVFNKFSNNQYDIGSDTFKLLSRRAINRVHSLTVNIPYRKAIYANSGLKNLTLSYKSKFDKILRNKKEFKSKKDIGLNSLIIFTDAAYKFALFMSFFMIFSTLSVAVYALVFYFLNQSIEGFTTLILVLTGSFFGVFSILTIIIKYLSVIVNLVFSKQNYLIESIEKINGM